MLNLDSLQVLLSRRRKRETKKFTSPRMNVSFNFTVKCLPSENLLKNLLKKVETQEKLKEPTENQQEKNKVRLSEILKKHGIDSA